MRRNGGAMRSRKKQMRRRRGSKLTSVDFLPSKHIVRMRSGMIIHEIGIATMKSTRRIASLNIAYICVTILCSCNGTSYFAAIKDGVVHRTYRS